MSEGYIALKGTSSRAADELEYLISLVPEILFIHEVVASGSFGENTLKR